MFIIFMFIITFHQCHDQYLKYFRIPQYIIHYFYDFSVRFQLVTIVSCHKLVKIIETKSR